MRRAMVRLSTVLVFLLAGAAACAGGSEAPGSGDGSATAEAITVYSGRSEELVGPILERFEAESGISVDVRYGESPDLALLIAEEGDRSPADVFFSQSPGAVGFLAEKDLLAELDEATIEPVDGRYRNAARLWVGVTGRQRVLVYNTSQVSADDLPSSVFDLTDPKYKGKIGVAPSNSSFQDFVTAMRLIEGEEKAAAFLKDLRANEPKTYAKNSAIVDAVGRGEVQMGLVNHYYNLRALAEDPAKPTTNHVFGDIGSIVIVASVSVLEASDNKDAAAKLVEFLLGTGAQEYFRDETFEYPLAGGVGPAADLPPLSDELPALDIDELGGGLQKTTELIAQSGFEA